MFKHKVIPITDHYVLLEKLKDPRANPQDQNVTLAKHHEEILDQMAEEDWNYQDCIPTGQGRRILIFWKYLDEEEEKINEDGNTSDLSELSPAKEASG